MRTRRTMRAPRAAQAAAGALVLALPSSAVALTSSHRPSSTPRTQPTLVRAWSRTPELTFGDEAVISGIGPVGARRAQLEYEPAGGHAWRPIARVRPRRTGAFTLRAPLTSSGELRVTETLPVQVHAALETEPMVTSRVRSRPQRVGVAARFQVSTGTHDVVAGQTTSITGQLQPAQAGRTVSLLEGTGGGGWAPIADTTTGADGSFAVRFALPTAGTRALRVSFPGDSANDPASASVGDATAFTESVASWYDDAGATACGFHATYGIASRTLPCGTQVTLSYAGRSVTATVDDRGPYVYGREYDLDQNTAQALGMFGVATILSSV